MHFCRVFIRVSNSANTLDVHNMSKKLRTSYKPDCWKCLNHLRVVQLQLLAAAVKVPCLQDNDSSAMWLESFPGLIGDMVTTAQERHEVQCLLETWRDIFVTNIIDMPCTDLIEHRIPTYQHIISRVKKRVLYTAEEVAWQKKNSILFFQASHDVTFL